MGKTLYKIRRGRIISGVCMGLSEYLNLDVNVIRLLVVIFSCTGGVDSLLILQQLFCFLKKNLSLAAWVKSRYKFMMFNFFSLLL